MLPPACVARSACARPLDRSPSGVAASFLRPELEGARLPGTCWCSGDFTMDVRIICWRADGADPGLARSLYCSAAGASGALKHVWSFRCRSRFK